MKPGLHLVLKFSTGPSDLRLEHLPSRRSPGWNRFCRIVSAPSDQNRLSSSRSELKQKQAHQRNCERWCLCYTQWIVFVSYITLNAKERCLNCFYSVYWRIKKEKYIEYGVVGLCHHCMEGARQDHIIHLRKLFPTHRQLLENRLPPFLEWSSCSRLKSKGGASWQSLLVGRSEG
jgi:hypothetical protein